MAFCENNVSIIIGLLPLLILLSVIKLKLSLFCNNIFEESFLIPFVLLKEESLILLKG